MQKIPLILTRPTGSNTAFAKQFPPELSARLDFIRCPLIRISPLDEEVPTDQNMVALFTSSNGVRFAPAAMGRRAYCVGQRTTRAASRAGWTATYAGRNAAEMVTFLKANSPPGLLCHFSGVHVRGTIVENLRAAGLEACRYAIYDQELLPLSSAASLVLKEDKPVIVPLFSPRVAAHFSNQTCGNPKLRVVCLSAAVADSLASITCFETVVSPEPSAQSLIDCVEKLVHSICLG